MIKKIRKALARARRAHLLRAKLDEWTKIRDAELNDFIDRTEAEGMEAALEAFEGVRHYLDTGREPMFMTLELDPPDTTEAPGGGRLHRPPSPRRATACAATLRRP